jgi:lipoyl(octanoyl) transferase
MPSWIASGSTMTELRIEEIGFGDHAVDYLAGWEQQRRVHADVVAGHRSDTVLLLEHQPVYTAGRRTEILDRPMDGTPVVDVDRGGKITWHGPGQLVGYPILRLPDPIDVVAYVRRIESMLIDVCAVFGVPATRVEGRSGVWTSDGERKIAAIGIRVSQGVTMHGFAINADCDLSWYDRIVPCGIRDATVTNLSLESGEAISVSDVTAVVRHHLEQVRGGIQA